MIHFLVFVAKIIGLAASILALIWIGSVRRYDWY